MGKRMPGFTPTIRAVSAPSPEFQRAAFRRGRGRDGQKGVDLSCMVRVPGADASNRAQDVSPCPEVVNGAVVS